MALRPAPFFKNGPDLSNHYGRIASLVGGHNSTGLFSKSIEQLKGADKRQPLTCFNGGDIIFLAYGLIPFALISLLSCFRANFLEIGPTLLLVLQDIPKPNAAIISPNIFSYAEFRNLHSNSAQWFDGGREPSKLLRKCVKFSSINCRSLAGIFASACQHLLGMPLDNI